MGRAMITGRAMSTGRAVKAAVLLGALLLSGTTASSGETAQAPGVYVILDGSGSMWGQLADGTHKITAAREVLEGFDAADYAGRELAFRVYGHRRKGDCADSELVVPFTAPGQAISKMSAFAGQVNPKGKTPISRSLRAALEDFGDRPGKIVLVSDGIETCDEDPCALVRAWREKNVAIRVHVVGLGLGEEERAAMTCISEAAGTEYRDARSADELAAGLASIQVAAVEAAPPNLQWYGLSITATNEAGEPMRVYGTARQGNGEPRSVSSNGHFAVSVGENEVTVGVRTQNGKLYKPVTRTVDVAASGKTVLEVVVPEPPSVRARFVEAGETIHGAFVDGYQDNKKVLGFRPMDRAYVDPGTYEFRSNPNDDNALSVTETFAEGDHKEIVFELVQTVRAVIKLVASGSGTDLRHNYELWQDGEKVYDVHWSNGVQARPGTYDVRLPNEMTPHTHDGLVITSEPRQDFRLEVPVGHVTFVYLNADGGHDSDDRVFLTRVGAGSGGRGKFTRGGQPVPLIAAEYFVEGWKNKGAYERVTFVVEAGVDQEVALRLESE